MKNKLINTMIVSGSHVAHIISLGMCISFGILYSEIRNDFQISHSKASWVASLFNGLVGLAVIFSVNSLCAPSVGLPLGFLSTKFGERKLTIIGTMLLCTGMITSRFVSQFQLLYLTYGLIAGTGAGIIHYCANMVIVRHFVAKWRPLAIVLGNSGSSVSSLIWPPIMTLCIGRYNWKTTFTVLGGCSAVGFMSAAAFAPVSNSSVGKTDDECPPKRVKGLDSSFKILKKVLQNADFMIFFTSTVVSFTVVFAPTTFLPDLMIEKQVERTKISLCAMVTGFGNLVGRLAGGFVSCKYQSHVAMIHGITLLGFGITAVCISFAETLEAFAILSTMLGVFSGGYFGLHMAVVSHYLDTVCLPVGFGLIIAANGLSVISGVPLAGLVSDTFDTSRGSFI